MKSTACFVLAFVLVVLTGPANAAEVIQGVTATASSQWGGGIVADNLVNNSGLRKAANTSQAASYDVTAVHTYDQSAVGQWHNNPGADPNGLHPVITFDLHGARNLAGLHIWNGNQWSGTLNLTTRGVQQFDVLVSTDGTNFTEVLADQILTKSPGNAYVAAQSFNLSGSNGITHVRLRVDSNYGDTYTGLSEVMITEVFDPDFIAPASHDFGTIGFSATSQAHLAVSNPGPTQSLDIQNVEVTGADAAFFTVDRFPVVLAAGGGADTIDVTFHPDGNARSFSASLSITSNFKGVPGTVTTVPLTGNAVLDPAISVPAGRDFGLIDPAAEAQASITVSNLGPSQDLHITNVALTGDGASRFTVNSFPASVAPSGSGTISVTFHPDGNDGDFTASLEITCDDSGVPGTVRSILLTGGTNRLVALSQPTILAAATAFPGYGAERLFDGSRNDYASWSQGAGDPFSQANGTWVELDFGSPVALDRMILITRMNNADVVGLSRLILSSDPVFDAADTIRTFATTGQNGQGLIQGFAATTARYARWEAGTSIGSSPNLGGAEMRFLDTPAGWVVAPAVVTGGASPYSANFALANAANGDAGSDCPGTEYACASLGTGMYVEFDLGASIPILGFDFFDRIASIDRTTSFDLLFSDDPFFTSGVTTVGIRPGSAGWGLRRAFSGITARYVRLDATGATQPVNGNTGMQEMIFYTAVPTGTPFEQYITTLWGLTGSDAAPSADPDHDGLANAIEFVLGSDPTTGDPGMAPTAGLEASRLAFTYRQSSAAAADNPVVQYSSDLAIWTEARDGQDGVTITTVTDGFAPGIDAVTVGLPRNIAGGAELFVRLAVTVAVSP